MPKPPKREDEAKEKKKQTCRTLAFRGFLLKSICKLAVALWLPVSKQMAELD